MWPFNRWKKELWKKRNSLVPRSLYRSSNRGGGNSSSYYPIYTPANHDSGSNSPGCDSGSSGGGDSGGGSCGGGS